LALAGCVGTAECVAFRLYVLGGRGEKRRRCGGRRRTSGLRHGLPQTAQPLECLAAAPLAGRAGLGGSFGARFRAVSGGFVGIRFRAAARRAAARRSAACRSAAGGSSPRGSSPSAPSPWAGRRGLFCFAFRLLGCVLVGGIVIGHPYALTFLRFIAAI